MNQRQGITKHLTLPWVMTLDSLKHGAPKQTIDRQGNQCPFSAGIVIGYIVQCAELFMALINSGSFLNPLSLLYLLALVDYISFLRSMNYFCFISEIYDAFQEEIFPLGGKSYK